MHATASTRVIDHPVSACSPPLQADALFRHGACTDRVSPRPCWRLALPLVAAAAVASTIHWVATRLRMHAHVGFLAHGEIHIEYADGCVVEHKAPQIVAIKPGHDGWVVGKEPVVLIEFDFEGDTIRRTGMPDTHRH